MLHNTFTDVCCCVGPAGASDEPRALVLVLSQAGQLLQINAARCVAKWVDLKVGVPLIPHAKKAAKMQFGALLVGFRILTHVIETGFAAPDSIQS